MLRGILPRKRTGIATCIADNNMPSSDAARETSSSSKDLDAELARSAPRVMAHMNSDHEESLVAWAIWYGKIDYRIIAGVSLTNVSSEGWTLDVTRKDLQETRRDEQRIQKLTIPFKPRITDAKQLRKVAVEMHKEVMT